MEQISVSSKEQTISLRDGYSAELFYNVFNKFWYYNLIGPDGSYLFYGISLIPDSFAQNNYSGEYPKLFVMDITEGSNEEYNPYLELGGRLALFSI